jgi:hypothetical protein
MEFPLAEVSNELMHKLKEFERSFFQMPVEIERVKIGCSNGNHGTVMKPASASSRGNFINGSKKETEILAEVADVVLSKIWQNPVTCAPTCRGCDGRKSAIRSDHVIGNPMRPINAEEAHSCTAQTGTPLAAQSER